MITVPMRLLALLLSLCTACGAGQVARTSDARPAVVGTLGAAAASCLQARFAALSRQAIGRVGVTVRLLETQQQIAMAGTSRFPMQSVYKLPIAMAVLDRVDRGSLRLEQPVAVRRDQMVARDTILHFRSRASTVWSATIAAPGRTVNIPQSTARAAARSTRMESW